MRFTFRMSLANVLKVTLFIIKIILYFAYYRKKYSLVAAVTKIYSKMKAAVTTAFLLVIFSATALPLPEIRNDTDIIITNPPDTCVTPDDQIIQKYEMIPAKIGECYGIRCNNELEVEDELCGMASIEKGCHGRSYDFSLPYPLCCPTAVC